MNNNTLNKLDTYYYEYNNKLYYMLIFFILIFSIGCFLFTNLYCKNIICCDRCNYDRL